MPFTPEEIHALPDIISQPRFTTYMAESANDPEAALRLYQWNLEISAAFIVPLQICEVSIRNAIVVVLKEVHGSNWHTSRGFEYTLSDPQRGYSPRKDLQRTVRSLRRDGVLTAGKVVAELKFVFWQKMLIANHDTRLWKTHIHKAFPNIAPSVKYHHARADIHGKLERVRKLRNRIAHHEPIFTRDLEQDYTDIIEMIGLRSPVSAAWVDKIQSVRTLLVKKPSSQ